MRRFTNASIRSAKPGRHSDGPRAFGLHLMVRATKAGDVTRRFQQRLRIDGTWAWRAIGHSPDLTLAQAREAARSNWQANRDGKIAAPVRPTAPTFRELCEAKITADAPSWKGKTEALHKARMAKHVYTKIGNKRVNAITTADLLPVFEKLNGTETGRKARQLTRSVFALAIGQGHRVDNH